MGFKIVDRSGFVVVMAANAAEARDQFVVKRNMWVLNTVVDPTGIAISLEHLDQLCSQEKAAQPNLKHLASAS